MARIRFESVGKTYPNGFVALDLLRHGLRPFVILLDLMMPELNGWDFRVAQQSEAALSGLPVVAMTAHSGDGPRGVPLLRKPVTLDRLLSAIEDACASATASG